jgi:4-amino-4-deoxy-L-arabinose transferase-like glycosyltransferase
MTNTFTPARPPIWKGVRQHWLILLVLVLLLATGARLTYSLGITRAVNHAQPELQTTDGYHLIAQSMYAGHGYRFSTDAAPATERPPAYPAFLYSIFSIFGVDYVAVQIAQALLGALGCWLLFLLGRWVWSIELGLTAALLYALYPNSVTYSANLYSENLFFPLFLALALFLCRAAYEGSARYGLLAGVAWGLSLLTRGTLLPLLLFVPIGIALSPWHRSPASRWLRWSVPALAAGILVVAPWAWRNYSLTGAFVPVSTWGWAPMYHGTQVAKRMTEWTDLAEVDDAAMRHVHDEFRRQEGELDPRPELAGREAVRYDRFAQRLTLAEWRADPLGFVERGALGSLFAWFFVFGARLRIASLIVHLPIFVLFIIGVVVLARTAKPALARAWPALGLVLFVNAFHAVAFPHVRYMSPAIALALMFAALPLLQSVDWFRNRVLGARARPSSAVA